MSLRKNLIKRVKTLTLAAVMVLSSASSAGITFTGVLEASAETVEQQVAAKVSAVAAECRNSGAADEYSIAKWLHDWLIYHADYDVTYTHYGPEGVLLYQKGACQSYTQAYAALLDQFGIENQIVISDSMNHTWNLVRINGVWTHVDCTWDDPIDAATGKPGGYENSYYFAIGDDKISQDHEWAKSSYPAAYAVAPVLTISNLPAPAAAKPILQGVNFKIRTSTGKTITPGSFSGGNIMIIDGSPTCSNTMGFISALSAWKNVLKQQNVNVIVTFQTPDEVNEFASSIPFTCGYYVDENYDQYRFMDDMGIQGSFLLPIVIIQNAQKQAFYYNQGYVAEPDRVVSLAVKYNAGSGTDGTGTGGTGTGGTGTGGTGTDGTGTGGTGTGGTGTGGTGTGGTGDDGTGTGGTGTGGIGTGGTGTGGTGTGGTGTDGTGTGGTGTVTCAHIWNSGIVTKKPTTTSTGIRTYICTKCHASKTETIAKLTTLKVGRIIKDSKTNGVYKVLKGGKTVRYVKPLTKKSTITIPASIKADGITCKVTEIGAKAFASNQVMKKVVIGANIKTIGEKAFYRCKKLKYITIKTKLLKSSTVKKNAFAGVSAKAKITAPSSKAKSYKKLLRLRGMK